MRRFIALVLPLALVPLVACAPQPAAESREVVVFAAASLTDAFKEIGANFERAHPDLGVRVTFNFGGSSQLRAQLEQGARADVFASADEAQMAAAGRAGLLAEEPRTFARSRLAIVTPRDNPRAIRSLADLAQEGVKLVTAQPTVPIGRYTAELLERASADPAYGADFRARVERNVVSREENVRQVVAKVALGEADAAVVYASDITPQVRGQLQQVPLPEPLAPLASYPAAVASGRNPAGGRAFLEYLLSPAGQEVLAQWGFLPASPASTTSSGS